MTQLSANAERFDPYQGFKFRIKWDGRYVAGLNRMGALKHTTELANHREWGDSSSSRKFPGRTGHDVVTLERGVTHDAEFEKWVAEVGNIDSIDQEVWPSDFRRDLAIDVFNEAGQVVVR